MAHNWGYLQMMKEWDSHWWLNSISWYPRAVLVSLGSLLTWKWHIKWLKKLVEMTFIVWFGYKMFADFWYHNVDNLQGNLLSTSTGLFDNRIVQWKIPNMNLCKLFFIFFWDILSFTLFINYINWHLDYIFL